MEPVTRCADVATGHGVLTLFLSISACCLAFASPAFALHLASLALLSIGVLLLEVVKDGTWCVLVPPWSAWRQGSHPRRPQADLSIPVPPRAPPPVLPRP